MLLSPSKRRRWFVAFIYVASLAILPLAVAAPAFAYSLVRCQEVLHRCPHCNGLVKVEEFPEFARPKSATPFDPAARGRRYRTDGSWKWAATPENDIVLCPLCAKYFWRRDATRLDPPTEADLVKADDAPAVRCYEPFDWNAAIAAGAGEKAADLRYLRLYSWWECNSDDCLEKGDADGRRNVEGIIPLLDTKTPGDRLLGAEALRELGRFDEAQALLEEPVPPEYEGVRAQLAHLVRTRSTKVQPIPGPCRPMRAGGPAPSCTSLIAGELDQAARDVNETILETVDALLEAPQLTKPVVEAAVNQPLGNRRDLGGGRWAQYSSDTGSMFAGVELHLPPDGDRSVRVVFAIGDGAALRQEDIVARYGQPDKPHFPSPGPTGNVVWRYRRDERSLWITMDDEDNLVTEVTISGN